MPRGLVKTDADEKLWRRAKRLATKEGHAGNYAYITRIFLRLKKGSGK